MWILGLKPSGGGALKPGRAVEGPSTVSDSPAIQWALLQKSHLTSDVILPVGSDNSSDDRFASDFQHTFKTV